MGRLSVRARTTIAAAVGVALALVVASTVLVLLMRSALADGVENAAEDRAEAMATLIAVSGVPEVDDDGVQLDDDLDDTVEQIVEEGEVVWTTARAVRLPVESTDSVRLGEDGDRYLVAVEDASEDGDRYTVSIAASLEDVDDSTAALLPLLGVGVPLLVLVVAASTWVLTGRALRPVADIRDEVEEISGSGLNRRVPVPEARDEIHDLATTMNAMLGRLEQSAEQQRRFVSDASHELRSPVASLRQAGEVAAAHPAAMPADELAETVVAESVRMQRLVEQLLVLARADEGSPVARSDVDLDDLVLMAGQQVRAAGLEADVSAVDVVRVDGDPIALSQVVRNLTDNAVRHATATVAFTLAETATGVEILVDDDGSGVPPEQREQVFDRFVRLDEARARDDGGSGLGLAIVREIVTRHGGTVAVEESPLGGARFAVRLPR